MYKFSKTKQMIEKINESSSFLTPRCLTKVLKTKDVGTFVFGGFNGTHLSDLFRLNQAKVGQP